MSQQIPEIPETIPEAYRIGLLADARQELEQDDGGNGFTVVLHLRNGVVLRVPATRYEEFLKQYKEHFRWTRLPVGEIKPVYITW